jgi:DNA-3-methyladenine glycosylase II
MNVDGPFDFERSAGLFARTARNLSDVFDNGVYYRVLYVEERSVLVLVSSIGTIQNPTLLVEVHPRIDKLKSLNETLRKMFACSSDFGKFHALAKKDRVMLQISKNLVGLRPIAPPTIFEALVIAITEQQISLDAAMAIRCRLIEKYGERIQMKGRTYYAFPTVKTLANANGNGLRNVGLSTRKAEYIKSLSKQLEERELDFEKLRNLADDSAIDALMQIRGVGRWTAEYVLIRGMGRINSLPADDMGIQRAVSEAYFHGGKVTSMDVRRIMRKFAPCSGIAAFYLMYFLLWMQKRGESPS